MLYCRALRRVEIQTATVDLGIEVGEAVCAVVGTTERVRGRRPRSRIEVQIAAGDLGVQVCKRVGRVPRPTECVRHHTTERGVDPGKVTIDDLPAIE